MSYADHLGLTPGSTTQNTHKWLDTGANYSHKAQSLDRESVHKVSNNSMNHSVFTIIDQVTKCGYCVYKTDSLNQNLIHP